MIQLRNLNKSYGEKAIFKDTNITFPNNGLVLFEGENGSGKTTLLNILSYTDTSFDGELIYNGTAITKHNSSTYRKFNIFTLYQDNILFEDLSIKQNIIKISPKKIKDQEIIEVLSKVNLTNNLNQIVNTLSTGEKKRLMISFSYLFKPDILLCDEVTNNLDENNMKQVLETLKVVSKDCLIIYVTHYLLDKFQSYFDGKLTIENKQLNLEFHQKMSAEMPTASKQKRKSIFTKIFYQNRFYLLFIIFINFILAGIGFTFIGISLPFNQTEHVQNLLSLYLCNNFPYIFFDDNNLDNLDLLKSSADIISKRVSVKANNNSSTSYLYYLSNLTNIEMIYGDLPYNNNEVIVSNYLFDESSLNQDIYLNNELYIIKGIYQSIDFINNNVYQQSFNSSNNLLESMYLTIGFIANKECISLKPNDIISYGINSQNTPLLSSFHINEITHNIYFENSADRLNDYLLKLNEKNIYFKTAGIVSTVFFIIFNLLSLTVLLNLNRKKLLIYRLLGLSKEDIIITLIKLIVYSLILPTSIFFITGIILNHYFNQELLSNIITNSYFTFAPYNYIPIIITSCYIILFSLFVFIYNQHAIKNNLKEALQSVKIAINH